MTAVDLDPAPAAAGTPIPANRGRWRLTLHRRDFTTTASLQRTGLAELVDARSRRLEQTLNGPAQLTFTVNGRSQSAGEIRELQTDVAAWRWSDTAGADVLMFRGIVTQCQDQLTEQSHTLNVTCKDYLAMLGRRYLTRSSVTWTQVDQDIIVAYLLNLANRPTSGAGADVFWPGSSLPLTLSLVGPDGNPRPGGYSGILRDRTYLGSQNIGEAIDNLSKVSPNGFDYDVWPTPTGGDRLRVFYPAQGTTRTDMALIFGSTLSGVDRTVSSTSYANYVRVLGNNGSSDPAVPQLYAETWNSDANNVGVNSLGLWMNAENASDVTVQTTLNEQAGGSLAASGLLIPSYSVTMRPGAYRHGFPNMGDTVPLVVISPPRLNVSTTVRVIGLAYAISDDNAEDVEIQVGRPAVTLASLLQQNARDVNALARR